MARPKGVDVAARSSAMYDNLITTFRAKGYDGASLSDLSVATGLAKASFYHRFPGGKPELGRATLAEAGKRFTADILRPLQSSLPARTRWLAMLDGIAHHYGHCDTTCLMNSMTLGEGATLFTRDIRLTINAWEKLMIATLVDMGYSAAVARVRAQDVIIRVQGALVLQRISDRGDVLGEVLAAMLDECADQ